jgi:SEC-C motif/Protein of unknown function (DUF1186)
VNANSRGIDELLAELRLAGQVPGQNLLKSIKALGAEAIPPLIAMVTDPAEYEYAEGDEANVSGWAPYAAVEMLGDMHPPEALDALLDLISWDDYDYLSGLVPRALGHFGRPAFEPLAKIVADSSRTVWTRERAMHGLKSLAENYPELRDAVVERLTAQLDTEEPGNEDPEAFYSFIVSYLVDLQAKEATASITRAFEEQRVDPMVISWSEVCEELDIPPEVAERIAETYPRAGEGLASLFPSLKELVPLLQDLPAPTAPQAIDTIPKVGRNERCPCGSGKKYKKCHGR